MSNIGRVFVSVADVKFLDTVTQEEIGQGKALTDSSFNSEIQSILVRGGYLNPLLFDVKHSRDLSVTMTSATFSAKYISFQTGTTASTASRNIYAIDECQTAVNGAITLTNQPTAGKVHVYLPTGVETDVAFSEGSKVINVGAGINGQCQCSYFFAKETENIVVDTKAEPMTVTAILSVHYREQDGTQGTYQIKIPLLKFSGKLTFEFKADGVATHDISGMALAYSDSCGNSKYADITTIPDSGVATLPQAIVAVPSSITLAPLATATASILAVMPPLHDNRVLTNGGTLTFVSSVPAKATVGASTGVITGVASGDTVITATYTPVLGTTYTTTIAVNVTA
ncbi:MAG: hypothetical protein WCO84_01525 [bacterium]